MKIFRQDKGIPILDALKRVKAIGRETYSAQRNAKKGILSAINESRKSVFEAAKDEFKLLKEIGFLRYKEKTEETSEEATPPSEGTEKTTTSASLPYITKPFGQYEPEYVPELRQGGSSRFQELELR